MDGTWLQNQVVLNKFNKLFSILSPWPLLFKITKASHPTKHFDCHLDGVRFWPNTSNFPSKPFFVPNAFVLVIRYEWTIGGSCVLSIFNHMGVIMRWCRTSSQLWQISIDPCRHASTTHLRMCNTLLLMISWAASLCPLIRLNMSWAHLRRIFTLIVNQMITQGSSSESNEENGYDLDLLITCSWVP